MVDKTIKILFSRIKLVKNCLILMCFVIRVIKHSAILVNQHYAFSSCKITQICFRCQRQNTFINKPDGIINIIPMQHFNSGMHITQRH